MDLFATALALAADGYHVFRLQPGSRVPLAGTHGVKDATTDLATVAGWWAREPDNNIGIAAGASGLTIVDLDLKNGKDGLTSWLTLLDEHNFTTSAPVVTTPSGGYHLYMRGEAAPSASKIGSGVDIRGGNSYVVAPGCMADGREYAGELPPASDLPEAPPELLTLCGAPRKAVERETDPVADLDTPQSIAQATEWLQTAAPVAVEGEGGNTTTYQVAAQLRSLGVSEGVADALLMSFYNPRCQPPWDLDDLTTINRNAYAYGQDAPGLTAPSPPEDMFDVDALPDLPEPRTNPFLAAMLSGSAIDTLPAPRWKLRGWLAEKSLNLIVGPYGSGKSFAAINIGMDLASGADEVLGLRNTHGAQTVLYIAGEGSHGLASRVAAWRQRTGQDTPPQFHILTALPSFAEGSPDWSLFLAAVRHINPDVVILDTVARMMTGMSENDSADMGLFAHRRMNDLTRDGAAVIAVHHPPKSSGEARGSSILPGAADSIVNVEMVRGQIQIRMGKLKDGERWKTPRGYDTKPVEVGTDPEGLPVTSLLCTEAVTILGATPVTKQEKQAFDTLAVVEAELRRCNDLDPERAPVHLTVDLLATSVINVTPDRDHNDQAAVIRELRKCLRAIPTGSAIAHDPHRNTYYIPIDRANC